MVANTGIPIGIGVALKEAREKAGMTKKEVGALMGVSPQTVASWENHESKPDDIEIYVKYNELSGFGITYLMGMDEYKSADEAEEAEKNKAEELPLTPEELKELADHIRY